QDDVRADPGARRQSRDRNPHSALRHASVPFRIRLRRNARRQALPHRKPRNGVDTDVADAGYELDGGAEEIAEFRSREQARRPTHCSDLATILAQRATAEARNTSTNELKAALGNSGRITRQPELELFL